MDKREAILEASLELFSDRGFHGTSVALIAEKAKVGSGTIYRYFKDKEVLVNELYQMHKKNMAEAILSGLDHSLPPRQFFHQIWQRMLEFSKKYPKILMFLEFHHHSAYLDEESRKLEQYFHKQFHDLFEYYRSAQITKDVAPEILLSVVTGSFLRLEMSFYNGEIERTTENEAKAEEICWEAIRR